MQRNTKLLPTHKEKAVKRNLTIIGDQMLHLTLKDLKEAITNGFKEEKKTILTN